MISVNPQTGETLKNKIKKVGLKKRTLTSTLLGLDQARSSVHTHNQAACHFRVQGAAVAGLVHPEDPADPGHHLVRRWVGRFVQVDKTSSTNQSTEGDRRQLRTGDVRWIVRNVNFAIRTGVIDRSHLCTHVLSAIYKFIMWPSKNLRRTKRQEIPDIILDVPFQWV